MCLEFGKTGVVPEDLIKSYMTTDLKEKKVARVKVAKKVVEKKEEILKKVERTNKLESRM